MEDRVKRRMNRKTQRKFGKGAVEIIEEATHMLRLLPADTFAAYYSGSLPFVLGFFYFWADMSRSPFASRHSLEASLAVALLFIWMKCWHTVFAIRLKTRFCKEGDAKWPVKRILRLIVMQTVVQPSGLFVLPAAMLLTFPFGWAYAFYQNFSFLGSGADGDIKAVWNKSWQYALLFQKQNHILLLILSMFSLILFLNLSIIIYFLPHLLNSLFGIETAFSKAGWSMFNTTFLTAVCGIVYLLLDPLIKAVYALRCYYAESLYTGEDLKAELRDFYPRNKAALIALMIPLILHALSPVETAIASGRTGPAFISAEDMDRSINEVFKKTEYRWKMPREKPAGDKAKGALSRFIDGIIDTVSKWLGTLKELVVKLFEWIGEYLKGMFRSGDTGEPQNTGWIKSINILLYALSFLIIIVLTFMTWRIWKTRKNRGIETATIPEHRGIDLTDDNIAADEFPADVWLNLARDLRAEGDFRLALRALYLASLSHLSQHGMIKVTGFKTNLDYEREFNGRAHAAPGLLTAFAWNMRAFESSWYGMHEVTADIVREFTENQERIMTFVGK